MICAIVQILETLGQLWVPMVVKNCFCSVLIINRKIKSNIKELWEMVVGYFRIVKLCRVLIWRKDNKFFWDLTGFFLGDYLCQGRLATSKPNYTNMEGTQKWISVNPISQRLKFKIIMILSLWAVMVFLIKFQVKIPST